MKTLMAQALVLVALVAGLVTWHLWDKNAALKALNASWSEKLQKANAEYLEKEKTLVEALNRNYVAHEQKVALAETQYRDLSSKLNRLRQQIANNRERVDAISSPASAVNGAGERTILDESLEENRRLAQEAQRLADKVTGLQEYINTILKGTQNDRKDALKGTPD